MKTELRQRLEFYRSLKREERRPPELRELLRPHIRATDAGPIVEGFACVYDVEYTVYDWLGEYTEKVASGAATKTLLEKPDVRYLVNHQGVPLGRTIAKTLELVQKEEGLWYETSPLDLRNPNAQEITSAIERGDVDGSSFAFRVTRQEWDEDFTERTIIEFSLHDGDVSSVTYPANPYTSTGLRAQDLVEQLATVEFDELALAARDRDDLTGVIAMAGGRLQELLEELAGDRPDPARDSSPTLSLDIADRDLELLELVAR